MGTDEVIEGSGRKLVHQTELDDLELRVERLERINDRLYAMFGEMRLVMAINAPDDPETGNPFVEVSTEVEETSEP